MAFEPKWDHILIIDEKIVRCGTKDDITKAYNIALVTYTKCLGHTPLMFKKVNEPTPKQTKLAWDNYKILNQTKPLVTVKPEVLEKRFKQISEGLHHGYNEIHIIDEVPNDSHCSFDEHMSGYGNS